MSSPSGGRRSGLSWIAIGLTVGLVGIVGALVIRAWSSDPSASTTSVAASSAEPNIDIYVYDLASEEHVRLTDHPQPDVQPVWSPDGTKLAFARFAGRNGGLHDLYVMDSDGTDERLLVGGPSDDVWPSWSPDGREIVFMSDRSTFGDIFAVDVETTELRIKRIATSPTADEFPDWSPVADLIAYVAQDRKSDETRIFTVRPDGTDKEVVSTFEGCCVISAVEWSPEGEELAITWLRHGQADVWRLPIAGGPMKRLTYGMTGDGFVTWSPDGHRLAFMTNRHTPTGDDIYVVDRDGSDERELVRTPWYDGNPDWSPDGRSIAFESVNGADI